VKSEVLTLILKLCSFEHRQEECISTIVLNVPSDELRVVFDWRKFKDCHTLASSNFYSRDVRECMTSAPKILRRKNK
jgi:hypothetical protein